jgi:hypothetical protein
LRIILGAPFRDEVQKQEHQNSSEQTSKKIECRRSNAHGEEEQLSLSPENRQGPGDRAVNRIQSSSGRHRRFLMRIHCSVELASWEQPREKVHGGDCHSHAEQNACEDAFGASFAKREGEASHYDGDKG